MKTKKYCFALDLIDDKDAIEAYKTHHKNVWPEILKSIKAVGIHEMEIYLVANRLFMIMETDEKFSLEGKQKQEESNSKVQEWETLMWSYQKALPTATPGEKWVRMEKIFSL
ncbi:MAG: L-rhamnose mutarotase [Flavobacteriia bacterium]